MSTITTRAGKGSPLTNTEVDNNFTNLNDDKLENVSEDTTPQLGGDLDLNSNDITGTGNIDVTGTVTADGLTVEGSTDVALITTNRPTYTEGLTLRNTLNWGYGASLSFDSITSLNGSNGEVGRIQSTWISTGYHGLDFYVFNNNSLSRQMRIAGNGDISFYDDAGTSQDFYWDASTSRLGLGTTSPTTELQTVGQIVGGTSGFGSNMVGFTGLGSFNSSTAVENIDALYLRKNGTDASSVSIALASAGGDSYYVGSRIKHIRSGSNSNGHLTFETKSDSSTNTTTERMRITDAGNVGIGTTSPVRTLHVTGGNDTIRLESTGANTKIEMVNTTSSTNEFGFLGANFFVSPNGSEAMRIDSSGKVGIGTTSPNRNLHVIGNATIEATTGNSAFLFIPTDTDNRLYSRAGNASTTPLPLTFFMGGSEAARIDSSGNLLVGTTNNTQYAVTDGGDAGLCYRANASLDISRQDGDVTNFNRLGSDGKIVKFRKDGTTVGSISVTSSATTYNTTSDARLKTSIEPIADATDRLMRMNPVSHKWIDNPEAGSVVGFIAQEMQSIVPEAVSGTPDGEEMMAMDYGRITPVLVAALQEALTRIESLENQISNLTGGS